MGLFIPTEGENKLMDLALKTDNFTLKLFVNNKTPADADTAASYTEMSTQGYAAKTLTAASWSIAQSGGKAEGSYPMQQFDFDGTGGDTTVYGYYVVHATGGQLLWAELFPTPETITTTGEYIRVTPKFTLAGENT